MTTTLEQANFDFAKRLMTVSDRDVEQLRAHFLDVAEEFDADTLEDHTLFPLEMGWFYGEPIWHEFTPEKRLMLNRLSFCQSYLTTAVAEVATNVLNLEAALETIIDDDPELALYMAREVVEETMHIRSFLCIIRKVCAHYGLTLEQLRAANPSLRMASHYVRGHSMLGWLRGDLHYYYFTRYALNVNQKTVERCSIVFLSMIWNVLSCRWASTFGSKFVPPLNSNLSSPGLSDFTNCRTGAF